jgi:cytochrome bd-type quinol oxidase subunit 2
MLEKKSLSCGTAIGQPTLSSCSLTASNAASARYGMGVALASWVVGITLVAGYFTYLLRSMRGKVGAETAAGY